MPKKAPVNQRPPIDHTGPAPPVNDPACGTPRPKQDPDEPNSTPLQDPDRRRSPPIENALAFNSESES